MAPNIKDGVIKGFVSRAHAICPQCNLHAEIEFLKSMFVENGYDHVHVNKIVDNYKPGQRRLLEDDNKHCIDHVETWFEYKAKNTFQERWYQGEIQINTKFVIHLMQKEQIVNRPAVNIWCLYDSMFLWKTIRGTGETIKTRLKQHQKAVFENRKNGSFPAEHADTCQGSIQWNNTPILGVCFVLFIND